MSASSAEYRHAVCEVNLAEQFLVFSLAGHIFELDHLVPEMLERKLGKVMLAPPRVEKVARDHGVIMHARKVNARRGS